MFQLENAKVEQSGGGDKITLVLLGKNSNDMSMIGNAILKTNHFKDGNDTCTKAEERVGDQTICVINTPGIFHRWNPETDNLVEMKPLYPGPRAFLLVLQSKQPSQEEMEIFRGLKGIFGEKIVENIIVVLVDSQEKMAEKLYGQADENLKKILDECGKRICVHDKKKANELTMQVVKEWKRIHEKQVKESSDSAPTESIYEEIDPQYAAMKPINEASWLPENSKENSSLASGSKLMMTVVLLGKISNKKCFVGNKIFQKDHFHSEKVSCERFVDDVDGEKVCIINTPDQFHKSSSPDPEADGMEELKPSYAGPRVFLFVLQDKTVSPEEMEMFTELKKKLGQKMVEQTIVLVYNDKNVSAHSTDTTLSRKNLETILSECGNRQCVYSNLMKNTELIKELMKHHKTSETHRLRGTHDKTVMPNKADKMHLQKKKSLSIVLLGQTGSGKSATGNTILKKQHFESHASSVPVTQECKMAEETVYETRIRVIDTPDFFTEDLKNQEEQIKKCKELAQPGPDVFLLVMQLGRFTEGEREVLPHLKREFGEDVTSKTVILFTGKEKLKQKTLPDYINGSDKELQELIKTCQERCCAFNNNKDKSSHQVKKLLEIISGMQENGGEAFQHSLKKKLKENKECSIL